MSDRVSLRARKRLVSLTVEARWRRMGDDPAAFFAECLWVPAGQKLGGRSGRARLELFDYQSDVLSAFRNERYLVVLKARQLGLTTLAMSYALWLLMFHPGSNVVLVSRNQTAANKALELLDFMYSFLPEWVRLRGPRPDSVAATHHSWRFSDGMVSQITSYPATRTVAAGQTASLVIWDEAALSEFQDDVLRTLLPTTDAGGQMIIFSTARGSHNRFARLWRQADVGHSEFKALFYPWHFSRLLNKDDYEAKRRALSDRPWEFYAEYPSSAEEAFRQSGRSRFPGLPDENDVDEFVLRGFLEWDQFDGVTFVSDVEGPFRFAPEALDGPPDGARPVVAIDPSSGSGGDFTAIVGGWLSAEGVPQRVAFWHSNMVEPAEAAEEAAKLGRLFRDSRNMDALMVVEKQGGYGDTFIHELRESLMYQNLYSFTYTGNRRKKGSQAYGFPMTYSRRPLVVDALAKWVHCDGELMWGIDRLLRQELGAFVVREDGRAMADAGMFDDMVMATAIWVYVLEERGVGATKTAKVEDMVQTYSVNHIFEEAERARQTQLRAQYGRRVRRKGLAGV